MPEVVANQKEPANQHHQDGFLHENDRGPPEGFLRQKSSY